jgi:NADH-quinone oxidoreductase subunit J
VSAAALYGLYIVLALLAGGIYLALPAERPLAQRLLWSGLVVAAAGLAGVGTYLAQWISPGEGRVFFVIFALLAIAASIRVVTHHRPVYSAVYLVLVVLAVAGLCILGAAEFLAAALVIVYGGAILVTYVFVIMLAQQGGETYYDVRCHEPLAAVVMGFALMATAAQTMVAADPVATHRRQIEQAPVAGMAAPDAPQRVADAGAVAGDSAAGAERDAAAERAFAELGNVRQIGVVLARDYMIAVQIAGILMLVAMVGAIAMARKRIDPQDMTPHERSQAQAAATEPAGRFVEPFARSRRDIG